jgi:hypothetical protein
VVAQLSKQGIHLCIHLDNIQMVKTETLAYQHAETACNLLEAVGFVKNYQKSNLIPRNKLQRAKKECQNLLDLPMVTVR